MSNEPTANPSDPDPHFPDRNASIQRANLCVRLITIRCLLSIPRGRRLRNHAGREEAMSLRLIALSAALLIGGLSADTNAKSPGFVGSLTCTINGGQGFMFGRTRHLACIFEPFEGGANQSYEGTITRFGQNLAAAEGKVVMVWSVFSKKAHDARPMISGKYTGVVGEGGAARPPTGMDGLIGGFENQYILQPVRNQPNANVNFAVAIGEIELRALRPRA